MALDTVLFFPIFIYFFIYHDYLITFHPLLPFSTNHFLGNFWEWKTIKLSDGLNEGTMTIKTMKMIIVKLIRKRNVISKWLFHCLQHTYESRPSRFALFVNIVCVCMCVNFVYCFGTSNQSLSMPCVARFFYLFFFCVLKVVCKRRTMNVAHCSVCAMFVSYKENVFFFLSSSL